MNAAESLLRCLELAHRRLDMRDRGLSPHLPGDQVAGVTGHQARPVGTRPPAGRADHLRVVA